MSVKVAFVGIRGIPVIYSGFESFVEDLIRNTSGPKYYVYCRSRYTKKRRFFGALLVHTPTIYIYKLETLIHSFISTMHATFVLRPNIIFYLGVGSAPFVIIPKLFGIKTIINVDGMDWDREKWGYIAKKYLNFCSGIAAKFADCVVTDSNYSFRYYLKTFDLKTSFIPYMSDGYKWRVDLKSLKQYNLKKNRYLVWAGRIVPDNHLHILIDAYKNSNIQLPLVVLGDDNYNTDYLKYIKSIVNKIPSILMVGFLPRNKYLNLLRSSRAYVETKQSGGTHPTLLDALTYAPNVICNDFKSNMLPIQREVIYYRNLDPISLSLAIKKIANNLKHIKLVKPKIPVQFQTKTITKQYLKIFRLILTQ